MTANRASHLNQDVRALQRAVNRISPIAEASIVQRGETIESVRKNYRLISGIPSQRHIRWGF